jgi:histidinol phosphatase-like enzyme
MSRFKYILEQPVTPKSERKLVGLFPFNTVVDQSSDVSGGKLHFIDSALEGLNILASKNYDVILFINQFKTRPLSHQAFESMNKAIENTFRSKGVNVAGVYWCPVIDKNDPFVTPNAGMFSRVTENQGIKWTDIQVLSTSENDLKAAERAGAVPVKIGSKSGKWNQSFDSTLDWVKSL